MQCEKTVHKKMNERSNIAAYFCWTIAFGREGRVEIRVKYARFRALAQRGGARNKLIRCNCQAVWNTG